VTADDTFSSFRHVKKIWLILAASLIMAPWVTLFRNLTSQLLSALFTLEFFDAGRNPRRAEPVARHRIEVITYNHRLVADSVREWRLGFRQRNWCHRCRCHNGAEISRTLHRSFRQTRGIIQGSWPRPRLTSRSWAFCSPRASLKLAVALLVVLQ